MVAPGYRTASVGRRDRADGGTMAEQIAPFATGEIKPALT